MFWCTATAFFSASTQLHAQSPANGVGATGGAPDLAPIVLNQIAQNTNLNPAINSQLIPIHGHRAIPSERFKLKFLNRLPSRFFLDANVEESYRYETNPFQFPSARRLRRRLIPSAADFALLEAEQQQEILNEFGFINKDGTAFRVIPNVTAGFLLTPRTKVYANYFFIRDQFLGPNNQLSSTLNSISWGVKHERHLFKRLTLITDFQARELMISNQFPVFDYLPSVTVSYPVTRSTTVFLNSLLQLRGTKYMVAPTIEIDPFYTAGFSHVHGQWLITASGVLVTFFRSPFLGREAQIDRDHFFWIVDAEVSRPISRKVPGLRGFVRAENIWNFNTNDSPGSSGYDFRIYGGIKYFTGRQPTYPLEASIRRALLQREAGTR